MIVDDSAVIRGLIARILEADPEIKVVASAADGLMAIGTLRHQRDGGASAEVLVLDIEMPRMDGLTAIPKLLEIDPDLKIVMASTLTLQNAEASLKALAAGASDYVAKPTSAGAIRGTDEFKQGLILKVKALAGARRDGEGRSRPRAERDPSTRQKLPPRPGGGPGSSPTTHPAKTPIALRQANTISPEIIAIGSSTGGPQALQTLLARLPQNLRVPILITQHMPPTFTTILAQHLARSSGIPAAEAVDGESILPGRIYVAPGDFHMLAERRADGIVLRLVKDAPENFCRPAVDPMFRAVARTWGARALAIVLTGMGQDGLAGGRALIEAGATLAAQDEKTSVVWGMPGAVATAGLCTAVLPIPELSAWMRRRAGLEAA
ncbi:MAG: chemotaxis response regulator protein-glutamate methylesterase [Proteobacteria bacterium]|nr:chemotaxis response regulator protein-glutamate methylesterase [Pseudomonadota bacterium]